MDLDQTELLDIARAAAAAGAAELRERFRDGAGALRAKSSPTDLVSEADLAAEAAIKAVLAARRPRDVMLAEEGGEAPLRTGGGTHGDAAERVGESLRWVVDPLDGTINFLFGLPVFAVSVACEDDEGALAGVVLDPMADECFSATRSGAARLDGAELRPERAASLDEALVATGFGYDAEVRARQAEVLTRVLPRVRDIRRAGAAALDLCWCAAGRCDAYYERGVKPWDIAAGALIATRAGLAVRELPAGGEHEPAGIVAAPPALIDELAALVGG